MSTYVIYTEKKPTFAVEAAGVLSDLRSFIGIEGLTGVRIINRYLVEGISTNELDLLRVTVFSEPAVDMVYNALTDFGEDRVFAAELLPGQFDQRADSCAQCIALATGKERPIVRCAKIYVLSGNVSDAELAAAKAWLVNPVESREAELDIPAALTIEYAKPGHIERLDGFIRRDDAGLNDVISDLGLAMDLADLALCQRYFRDAEGRDPTMTEIRVLDTYWSDHCRHTTFLTELTDVDVADDVIAESYLEYLSLRKELGRDNRPVTLMDMATIGARALKARGLLTDLDESEEINACSVKIEVMVNGKIEDWLLMFKNETHNHPTEIEPFGGAATCLGGAIRDPLSGRAYVYQAMRVTGAGDPRAGLSDTLPGKLPQLKLCRTAAAGYSSYGNEIGAATGHVHEIYHPGYVAKRMELGAVIAAAPARNVVREKPAPGDVVILLGGKTGRDGCGGATGSSKSHTLESIRLCGAEVQRGNPAEERKIVRLFRSPEATRLIKRCNDFGAGGVSVAIGELADGLIVDLDKVPVKYGGLNGTELAISESQERMAIVVSKTNAGRFIQFAEAEGLDATVVASVTEEPRLVLLWNGNEIVNLSREFLNSNGAPKQAKAFITAPVLEDRGYPVLDGEGIKGLMGDLSICSQKGLAERFDSSAGAGTMLAPHGGVYQLTPAQAMAARIPVLDGDTSTCSVMAFGYDPFISSQSPYHGAVGAVIHSVAKVIAAGGSRKKCWLTFQEYFERLREDASRWGKPAAALLGALDAQLGLGCGAIGGKDSMSGSFEGLDVPPALVSFAVSVADGVNLISNEFKETGSKVYFLHSGFGAFDKPDYSALRKMFDKVEKLIMEGKVKSAWAVSSGGAAEAVVKMGLGNNIGFRAVKGLTAEPVYGGFVIEANELPGYEDCLLGETIGDYVLTLSSGEDVHMNTVQKAWEQGLERVYPCLTPAGGIAPAFSYEQKIPLTAKSRVIAPRFVIPVFPGTSSEYDTARAIRKAGGRIEYVVIRNRSAKDIAESLRSLELMIHAAQVIVIPGGFSGGDEPDGAGKFIASVFRNPAISSAVADLLQNRDGLICGIGNGFQALIKLGLVPYGEIRDMAADSPALTFNKIGRHQSVMARVRVASAKSPWLNGHNVGDCIFLPASYGEGRFTGPEETIKTLGHNGQIATQYVDLDGNPTLDIRFNPGGSEFAVEALTSPDGRVIGRMCNSERSDNSLFINIPGEKEMNIFSGAVRYYK